MTLRIGRNRSRAGNGARRTAFTLVELILVMALLATVMAVSAPALARFFRGRTLEAEAKRLLALTRHGQSRAVHEAVPMILWIDPQLGGYGLEAAQGYVERDERAVEFRLHDEIDIDWGQARAADRRQIRFDPDGSLGDDSPETIWVRDRRGEARVMVPTTNRLSYEILADTNLWRRSGG